MKTPPCCLWEFVFVVIEEKCFRPSVPLRFIHVGPVLTVVSTAMVPETLMAFSPQQQLHAKAPLMDNGNSYFYGARISQYIITWTVSL